MLAFGEEVVAVSRMVWVLFNFYFCCPSAFCLPFALPLFVVSWGVSQVLFLPGS